MHTYVYVYVRDRLRRPADLELFHVTLVRASTFTGNGTPVYIRICTYIYMNIHRYIYLCIWTYQYI